MTDTRARPERATINIKVRRELRARVDACATLEGLTVPEFTPGGAGGALRTVREIARATGASREGRRRHARGRVTRWTCYSC